MRQLGVDIRGAQPAPGNIEGGLTTIEEKSLGAIKKAGSAPLVGVLGFAERPKLNGLNFMDTPGQDIEQMVAMVAGGCQLVAFTTGRGTPTGSPIAAGRRQRHANSRRAARAARLRHQPDPARKRPRMNRDPAPESARSSGLHQAEPDTERVATGAATVPVRQPVMWNPFANMSTLAGHTLTIVRGNGTTGRSSSGSRGPQPSKLVMRVRFPSPAPPRKARSGT